MAYDGSSLSNANNEKFESPTELDAHENINNSDCLRVHLKVNHQEDDSPVSNTLVPISGSPTEDQSIMQSCSTDLVSVDHEHHPTELTTREENPNSIPAVYQCNTSDAQSDLTNTFTSDNSQESEPQPVDKTNENNTSVVSKLNESANDEKKPEPYSPIRRLLEPTCEGIRSRIELLGELLSIEKFDPIPDIYDEMKNVIESIERNERLQNDRDGQTLLYLTTAAKSNLNADLNKLDIELQRQFGLHSVDVTGDGACSFRAVLISGMQQSDSTHSQLRKSVVTHVLNDVSYYSTVLRPGDKVTEKDLNRWAWNMVDPNTYTDELANIALSDHYHMQLVIFRAGELLTIVNPRDGLVEHTAFLVNVGTHYKALVPQHQLEAAREHSERFKKSHLQQNSTYHNAHAANE